MILRLALRYSFSPSRRHRRSSLRILVSTALSVAVLLTVISMMEYMQGSRLDAIRAVRSFDAVIAGDVRDAIKELFPSASVFLYAEEDALSSGRAVTVRFIDEEYDGGIHISGSLEGLVVPYTEPSAEVALMMMGRGRSGVMMPVERRYVPTGAFYSDMGYEFDGSYMFLPLSERGEAELVTGVKGIDDEDISVLEAMGYDAVSWKESESALYSALLMEKVMMYLVLSLLFIVILVSQKSSARRFYRAKRKEAAGLELLGMGRMRIDASFILSFLIVMVLGLSSGGVLALALIPVSERAVAYLGFHNAVLSFPLATFLCLSLILILLAFIIVAAERRRDGRVDIQEVLRDE